MAKIKEKKKTEKAQKKKITIKKPNIKFSKIDFKELFSKKIFKISLMVLAVLISFILVDLFFQYLNNGYSVAVVDGTRIPKSSYHKRLEAQYGETTAKQLIDEQLIKLEAKKNNAEATDEEIQTRLDEIIASVGGQEAYESALVVNNISEEELKSQIELDVMAKKILEPTIEYTEEDVMAFFEQYSAVIYPNETAALEEGEKLDYQLFKDEVLDVYIQQQVENQKYIWLESLYTEYKIQDNSVSRPSYGVLSATINILKNVLGEANDNKEE